MIPPPPHPLDVDIRFAHYVAHTVVRLYLARMVGSKQTHMLTVPRPISPSHAEQQACQPTAGQLVKHLSLLNVYMAHQSRLALVLDCHAIPFTVQTSTTTAWSL